MSLLRFTSCRGTEKPAVVWLESTQVALIVPQQEFDGHKQPTKNVTAITLHSGVRAHVIEDAETVRGLVQNPTGPNARAADAT